MTNQHGGFLWYELDPRCGGDHISIGSDPQDTLFALFCARKKNSSNRI